jgi:hypothetical protein
MAEKVGILLLHAFKRCAENGLTQGSKEIRGMYINNSLISNAFSSGKKSCEPDLMLTKFCVNQV